MSKRDQAFWGEPDESAEVNDIVKTLMGYIIKGIKI